MSKVIGYAGSECAGQVAKIPVAQEVMNYAERLASASVELAEQVNNTLSSVARQPVPMPACGKETCEISREYPPLFSELRDHLDRIERSINNIRGTIDRTEL